MNEVQQVVDRITGHLARIESITSAMQIRPSTVVLSLDEAKTLIDAAQLVGPLQERCQLLGRALAAVWGLVSEEDQRAVMDVLQAPCGPGKTLPANVLVEILERKGARQP